MSIFESLFSSRYADQPERLSTEGPPPVLRNKDGFEVGSIPPTSPMYRDPNRPPKKRLGHPDKPHGHKKVA